MVRGVIHYIFSLAVRDVIEYLWYGQTIKLQQTDSLCPPRAGLMVWSLWPIYFVCNAGKLDSLFPDDSYIDMGEIDVGRKVAQQIPPGIFWRSQVFIDHPMYLKFNVSLSKDALVGIYGRRGLPPSHTQVGNIWTSLTPIHLVFVYNTTNTIILYYYNIYCIYLYLLVILSRVKCEINIVVGLFQCFLQQISICVASVLFLNLLQTIENRKCEKKITNMSAYYKDSAYFSILPLPQNINWDIVLKNLSNHVGACHEYKPIHKSFYCIMNHLLCYRKDLWQISFRFNIINESHKDTGLRGQEREIFLYTNFPYMRSTESDISCY